MAKNTLFTEHILISPEAKKKIEKIKIHKQQANGEVIDTILKVREFPIKDEK